MSLQRKTMHSVASSSVIQMSSQVLNFGISILIARVLSPEEFGVVAIALVFVALAQTLSDLGLSSSLIQKTDVSDDETFSCLCINLLIGLIMALMLFLFSRGLAKFYDTPELSLILISLCPLFFINSFASVPRAILSRKMKHGQLALCNLLATLMGSLVALILVYLDFGLWALVIQHLTTGFLNSLLLVVKSRLKFAKFKLDLLLPLLPFSLNVFITRVLQEAANQADKVIIGKFMGPSQLGFYTKADQLARFPLRNITGVVSNVMFPALSKIKEDKEKVKLVYLRAIGLISTFVFPILAGLAYLANDIIFFLLGEKWLPLVPYFMFFCISFMLLSIGQISGAFFLSQGKADVQLRLIAITQSLKVVLLLIGAQFGQEGIIISLSIATLIGFNLTMFTLARILNVTFVELIESCYKTIVSILIMVGVLSILDGLNYQYRLILFPIVGATIYIAVSIIIKNSFFWDAFGLILQVFKSKKVS